MAKRVWVYVGGRAGNKPPLAEKAAITASKVILAKRLYEDKGNTVAEICKTLSVRPTTISIESMTYGNCPF